MQMLDVRASSDGNAIGLNVIITGMLDLSQIMFLYVVYNVCLPDRESMCTKFGLPTFGAMQIVNI